MKSLNTIYLCGPINGCTDKECKDWREFVKTIWDGATLDPMRRDYRGREHESVNQIVEFDKIDVINSDVILVNYDKPSVGTSMEVLYAWERGKLVVVVSKNGKQGLSPWLLYHSHAVCTSFEQAVNYVREVLK